MSSHLPPPIAPPSVGTHSLQPEHVGQGYAQPQQIYRQQPSQSYPQAPLNGYPQAQNGYPIQQQPLSNQYLGKTSTPQQSSSPTKAPVVIGHISNYHSKDSQRQDNTYHPSLSPKQTAEALVESAVARHHTRVDVLFLKAVWGGILLSYGGFLEAVVGGSPSANTNNPGLLRLVEGLVFPVGLTLIVLTGMELLTSNMMIIELGVFKRRIPWWGIAYNWSVVFFGNLAGSLFFAAILVRYAGLVTDPIRTFITNAANSRGVLPWHEVFLRGIGCNIMVCLAVYVATQAADVISKVVGVYFVLSAFVVLQFEHVVADMFTIPMGMMLGAGPSVGKYIWLDLIGALVGNIVGATLLSISLYWMYLHGGPTPGKVTDKEKGPDNDSEDTVAPHQGANAWGSGDHFQ
ncbi:hypothetical protein QFC20_003093 [Naganishia adeliensis]|uniref:Uncharacterized protein n=1 Tax=Naganishia adeliensis TaxID=92952 RepID=A0ACC2WE34_9TREE|nr:hypothetical protein QFC20_003093 [Naganishia adeliensis]